MVLSDVMCHKTNNKINEFTIYCMNHTVFGDNSTHSNVTQFCIT